MTQLSQVILFGLIVNIIVVNKENTYYLQTILEESDTKIQSNYNTDWWWSDHSFYSMTFWLEKVN